MQPFSHNQTGALLIRHPAYFVSAIYTCHSPVPKPVAKRLKEHGKPHKLVIMAIAERLVTVANAIIKIGTPWQHQPAE
jgi:transposase